MIFLKYREQIWDLKWSSYCLATEGHQMHDMCDLFGKRDVQSIIKVAYTITINRTDNVKIFT